MANNERGHVVSLAEAPVQNQFVRCHRDGQRSAGGSDKRNVSWRKEWSQEYPAVPGTWKPTKIQLPTSRSAGFNVPWIAPASDGVDRPQKDSSASPWRIRSACSSERGTTEHGQAIHITEGCQPPRSRKIPRNGGTLRETRSPHRKSRNRGAWSRRQSDRPVAESQGLPAEDSPTE